MTQLAIPDELAERIFSAAESCGRTPQALLDTIFNEIMESDEDFARRMLTPELGQRIAADMQEVEKGNFFTNEQGDEKFEALFRHLRSK
jgi:DNA-binding ferritin-like protein